MKHSFLLASLALTAVEAFTPLHVEKFNAGVSLNALDQDGNHIPPNNKFWPKADKKLVGDFYGELNTQKTLKLNKASPTAVPPPLPLPPPPPPPQQATVPPPTTVTMGQDKNSMPDNNTFFPKAEKKVAGNFYQELNANNNGGHPMYNKFYPKADKRLVGDFYGELKTQKTLKVPK